MLEILEGFVLDKSADPQHSVAAREYKSHVFFSWIFFVCVFFHVYESMRCYAPSEREIHERLLEFDAFLQRLPGRLGNCVSHLPRFATADVVMVVLRQAQTGDAGALRR